MNQMRDARRLAWSVLAAWPCWSTALAAPVPDTSEVFKATAVVKTAGGASVTMPVSITVDRKTPPAEADALAAAFKSGGGDALHTALAGITPTGWVTLAGETTPTRVTFERAANDGRLLTILTDQPLLFFGAGLPDAPPKDGYDFAVIDLILPASGAGAGTIAPAAQITHRDGAFVVKDYGQDVIWLTDVIRRP
jgi:hypothetical protein